jgi:hypothetical protein
MSGAGTLEGASRGSDIGAHLEFLEPSALLPTFPFPFHAFDGHELHICVLWPAADDGLHP